MVLQYAANASDPAGDFVLTLVCPDRSGIVHAVTGFLVRNRANIIESQQFGDRLTNRFFMRIDFEVEGAAPDVAALREDFADVAAELSMAFELWDAAAPYRTLIMVSKHLHCLNDLLFRTSTGAFRSRSPRSSRTIPTPRHWSGPTASTSTTFR